MTQPKRPLKVFLCHAHADRDAVRALYTRLTNDGVDAWLDKEKLLGGQNWKMEIRTAVEEADVVIVCHSKEFNKEGFRQREVKWALDVAMEKPEGEIFIIPVRLEECEVIKSLREWHWVDLFEKDGYDILAKALKLRSEQVGAEINIDYKIGIAGFDVAKVSLSGQIGVLNNLALTHLKNGAYKKSLEHYQQAMSIANEIRDMKSQCVIAIGLGIVYWEVNNYAESRECFKLAIHLGGQLDDKKLQVSALNNLAFTFESIGDLVRATELYENALLLSREIGL